MITTRTRILSILATVAMLVSMLTCFVIPASAAEISDYVEVWNDIASGADNLSDLIDENGVKDAATTVDQLKAAAEADAATIVWKDFVWNTDPFPRYAYHAAYEAAGYAAYDADKTEWSISDPADWVEMVRVSNYDPDDAAYVPDDFKGEVFHVTGNIDFTGVTMSALSNGEEALKDQAYYPFNGTIEGHGNAFQKITVVVDINNSKKQCVTGMIGKLGPYAKITNFGVDSGTIQASGTASSITVSTFGEAVNKTGAGATISGLATQHAELTSVWSGATVGNEGATANGIDGHSQNAQLLPNGLYFFGELKGDTNYAISNGGNTSRHYNALSNTVTAAAMIGSGDSRNVNNNMFSVGSAETNPIAVTDYTGSITNKGNVESPEEGAWEINKAQPAADGVPNVYFTITGVDATSGKNIIRPNGNVNNRIIKVTINNVDHYINKDTVLNYDKLVELSGEAFTVVSVDGEEKELPLTTEDEMVITLSADAGEALNTAWANYSGLLKKYLSTEAADAWQAAFDAVAAVDGAANQADAIATAEGKITELETALTTYGTYADYTPENTEKEIPGYSLKATYGAYNVNKTWAISSVDDWKAMVTDSNAEENPATFDDVIFEVTGNIDFSSETVALDPLNLGNGQENDSTAPFQGTINGNGFELQSIDVLVKATAEAKYNAGLIGKIGPNAFINDFGIDSNSTICVDGKDVATQAYASSFGEFVGALEGIRLNKVWSGATVTAKGGETNMVTGITAGMQDTLGRINGAYFFGTLDTEGSAYGMSHKPKAEQIYNALSDPKATAGTEILAMNNPYVRVQDGSFQYNNQIVGDYAIYENFPENGDDRVMHSGNVESAGEGAWKINSNQPGKVYSFNYDKNTGTSTITETEDTYDEVYFSYNENGDIRFGEEANRIVQYNVTINGEAQDPVYANAGAAVDLIAALGLHKAAEITSVTDAEGTIPDVEGKYEIDSDTTVAVQYSDAALCELKAEELQTYIDAYDAYDANLVVGGETLTTFKNAVAEVEDTAADSAERVAALDAAIEDGKAIAADEAAVLALKAGLEHPNFPAYKDHALYEKYTANITDWLIVDPADWYAMDAYVTAQTTAGDYFTGVTFHLIDDVDFDGEEAMLPLGIKTTKKMTFAGIIDGHGYGFENIDIYADANDNLTGTSFKPNDGDSVNKSVGLIGFLGNCTIQNFGVSSGSIELGSSNAGASVSTFGCIPADKTANFTKVWSGVTLDGATNPYISALAGIERNSENSAVNVNGFTFYGDVDKSGTGVNLVYGVFGGYDDAPATTSAYNNIITYPNVKQDGRNTYLFGAGAEDGDFKFSNYTNISNVYGLKKAAGQSKGVGFDYDYRFEFAKNYGGSDATTPWLGNMTMLEAACDLNTKDAGVYIKLAEDGGIRPTGTAAEHLVTYIINKVTDNVSDGGKTEYANSGEAVDVVALFELDGASSITVTVGGITIDPDENGKYEITGNAVITANYEVVDEKIEQLNAILEPYAALTEEDEQYLKFNGEGGELEGEEIGLAAFRDQAAYAITERNVDLVDAAIAAAENLVVEVTEKGTNFPAYKDHAKFDNYQPAKPNWLIVTPEDWYAMDAFANAQAAGDYFTGTTFHLIDDVDFDGEEAMLPLGIQTTKKLTFAGTIDGHGYGFENVDIYASAGAGSLLGTAFQPTSTDKVQQSIGLFGYLGNCTIQNFGINSGSIQLNSSNAGASVSTFGFITADTTVNFTKVWSGVTLIASTNPYVTPLAGLERGSTTSVVNVNGLTFYGDVDKSNTGVNLVYGVFGGYDSAPATTSAYNNIISYPNVQQDGRNTFLFGAGAEDGDFKFSNYTNISNVYGLKKAPGQSKGVGFDYDYRYDFLKVYGGNDATPAWLGNMTMLEAAYDLNTKNAGVYIKLAEDGSIRPTGTETDKMIRVHVTDNGVEKYLYFNNGAEIELTAENMETTLNNLSTITVGGEGKAVGDTFIAADNLEIVIETQECDHTGNTNTTKVLIEGEKYHHIICSVCGEGINREYCGDCLTETAESPFVDDTLMHTRICECGTDYSKVCTKYDFVHDSDCSTPDKWTFTCGIHAPEYIDPNFVPTQHVFPESWTNDDNVANKQYKVCENTDCEVKQYQYVGTLDGGNISVKALKDSEYVIELPDNLASATLTFTKTGNYTYEVIEGATLVEGDVYTVAGATQVKVKVTAALTANGGTLTVAMTNAKATAEEGSTEEIAITNADAIIAITHSKVEGDATGDDKVNLQDALAALYVKVERYDETTINVANVDTNGNTVVDIEEVYAIVKSWLSDIVATA